MIGLKEIRSTAIQAGTVLCLILVGCTTGDSQQQTTDEQVTAPVSDIFRGNVVYGHEVRSFRPCGLENTQWVQDQTGILWDLHQELALKLGNYEELYFVLSGRNAPAPTNGFGSDYSGELVVDEVLYAAREGFSCETEWTEFVFRAYGNEPFWSAELSSTGLVLRRMGESDLYWESPPEERVGTSVIYTYNDVSLEVTPEPCRDSMSGAFFGHTAHLRFRSEKFFGCALKGQVY